MHLPDYFKQITTFVFDMDGVLTDGTLWVHENNQIIRRMHIKDGYALQLAIKKGYRVVVISGSNSEPVVKRLNGLGVTDVFMKVDRKKEHLEKYMREQGLRSEQVLFMGDDMPDYPVMKIVGLACAPADAVPEIKEIARYISPVVGGMGCVRDVIEKVLKLNDHWDLEAGIASR
jgi:3-deoxy-D-manno-octulosonate 8-phosphate phosphatase (KDO 8-P phosphatase)